MKKYIDFVVTVAIEDFEGYTPSSFLQENIKKEFHVHHQKLNLDTMTVSFIGRVLK